MGNITIETLREELKAYVAAELQKPGSSHFAFRNSRCPE